MVLSVAELLLTPLSPANIKLGVTFIGEAHATVELDGPVTGIQQRLDRMGLGHTAGDFCVRIYHPLLQQGSSVVNKRAGRIRRGENIDGGVF